MAVRATASPSSRRSRRDERDVRGINDRAQLAAVERILQQRRAAALMRDGVSIADPARIDIRGNLACGRDVRIDVGCVFEGDVTLGRRRRHRPVLRAARRAPSRAGTTIEPFSYLVDATVGARLPHRPVCAPASRARRWTTRCTSATSSRSRRARWDAGRKANHLAYIGDTTVGAGVNYGAGSITANYDGAQQAPDGHRRPREHRLQLRAGGAGDVGRQARPIGARQRDRARTRPPAR